MNVMAFSDLLLYFARFDTYAVKNKFFIQARQLLKLNWKRKCIRWLALGAAVDMVVLIAVTLRGIGMQFLFTLKPGMSPATVLTAHYVGEYAPPEKH